MASTDPVSNLTPGEPTLEQRIEQLERHCSLMWSDQLEPRSEREAAYEQLAQIENRIAGLSLRTLSMSHDATLESDTSTVEAELRVLSATWATPPAA
jgi:hypothetical protein